MIEKSVLEREINELVLHSYTKNNFEYQKEFEKFSINHFKTESDKAILGLDIYQYSEFDDGRQPLIPFLFDILLEKGFTYSKKVEPSLFPDQADEKDQTDEKKFINFKKKIISTGDGGFIIFSSPIKALVFNLYFFTALHMYNSGHLNSKLHQYVGDITIRSALTYDKVFNYEHNWYGKGIIKNARILNKDTLNRFIIDKETYKYFMETFYGIETLSIVKPEDFKKAIDIKGEFKSLVFGGGERKDMLKNIHIQKINDVLAKSTKLIIYNIEIQFCAEIDQKPFIFTLGNSNVTDVK